jgi:hypothetical protein
MGWEWDGRAAGAVYQRIWDRQRRVAPGISTSPEPPCPWPQLTALQRVKSPWHGGVAETAGWTASLLLCRFSRTGSIFGGMGRILRKHQPARLMGMPKCNPSALQGRGIFCSLACRGPLAASNFRRRPLVARRTPRRLLPGFLWLASLQRARWPRETGRTYHRSVSRFLGGRVGRIARWRPTSQP